MNATKVMMVLLQVDLRGKHRGGKGFRYLFKFFIFLPKEVILIA